MEGEYPLTLRIYCTAIIIPGEPLDSPVSAHIIVIVQCSTNNPITG
jgi:hypothetical protein